MAKKLTKKSLYDVEIYQEVLERINQLGGSSPPQWGTMTVSQMLSHCAEVQATYNGKDNLTVPWYFYPLRPLVRRTIFGMQPYPSLFLSCNAFISTFSFLSYYLLFFVLLLFLIVLVLLTLLISVFPLLFLFLIHLIFFFILFFWFFFYRFRFFDRIK